MGCPGLKNSYREKGLFFVITFPALYHLKQGGNFNLTDETKAKIVNMLRLLSIKGYEFLFHLKSNVLIRVLKHSHH